MPFIPRLKPQIHQELLARVIARSKLTDVEASSVINAILSTLAEEFEAVEFNMRAVRDSYDIRKVAAQYLDERIAELPPTGLARLQAASASAAAMSFFRENTSGELVIPAGSTFGRQDSEVLYVLQSDITMADGQATYPAGDTAYATVRATIAGEIGNTSAGTITEIIDAPATLTSVTNENPVLGGQDVEPDSSVRNRAQLYLSSLARCQKSALESAALSFQSSDGVRVRHALVADDPLNPGSVDMIIDDGSGLESASLDFVESRTFTVGLNKSPIITHEAPATRPIDVLEIDFNDGQGFQKVNSNQFSPDNPGWVSHPEKGVIILQGLFETNVGAKALTVGSRIRVPENTFLRYTGVVKELQEFVDGKVGDVENFPGMRSVGVRVVVQPPVVENIDMVFAVVFEEGADFSERAEEVKTSMVEFCRTLGPGQTLYLGLLTSHLIESVPELLSVHFQDPSTDRSPMTHRHAIRVDAGTMVITQQKEV